MYFVIGNNNRGFLSWWFDGRLELLDTDLNKISYKVGSGTCGWFREKEDTCVFTQVAHMHIIIGDYVPKLIKKINY